MIISIGVKTEEMMKLLGIESFPFDNFSLKSKFRENCFKYHPDKNPGDKKAEEMMKKINVAYEYLEPFATKVDIFKESVVEDLILKQRKSEETDMFKIFEVCPDCHGVGSHTRQSYETYTSCIYCDGTIKRYSMFEGFKMYGTGFVTLDCYSCGMKGYRYNKETKQKETCSRCHGAGKFQATCKHCNGAGLQKGRSTITITCFRCDGTGRIEIKPFNPVIRRGAVMV